MIVAVLVSLLTMVGSVAGAWIVVVRLPEDYFLDTQNKRLPSRSRPHALLVGIKNIGGLLVLLSGVAMLFLPGQGLLTILVGLLLMDFPGKYRLERVLASRQTVRAAMNWMRARRGAPPLRW